MENPNHASSTIKDRIQAKAKDLDDYKNEIDRDLDKLREAVDVKQWVSRGRDFVTTPSPARTTALIIGGVAVGLVVLGLFGGGRRKRRLEPEAAHDLHTHLDSNGHKVIVMRERESRPGFWAELVRISMQTFVLNLLRKLLAERTSPDAGDPDPAPAAAHRAR